MIQNTQNKYFDFLFNNPKLSFIESIEKALLENINKPIEKNINNLEIISSNTMNKKKELLYYALLKNNINLLK